MQFNGDSGIITSVYDPATYGVCKRFNKTLKTMMREFIHEGSRNWNKWLDSLFEVREYPKLPQGFPLWVVVWATTVDNNRVLDLIKKSWECGFSYSKNEIQYVSDLRAKLHSLYRLSQEHSQQAQEQQKHR